jgi:hypothetical protein
VRAEKPKATFNIIPEAFRVVMARITNRARLATDRWTAADLQKPKIDEGAVQQGLRSYLERRDAQMRPLLWFADGTSARAHIRAQAAREPQQAYWPENDLARALDLAWFAGGMRPPIRISTNWLAAVVDWEKWIYAVTNFNAARARDPALEAPSELLPIEDGFPEPPGAGEPADVCVQENVVSQYCKENPSTFRAVHPEKIWTPMITAFAGGLYFYWIASDHIVCIPRPSLWVTEGTLHREDGPAVLWPSGEQHVFRHGLEFLPQSTL